MGVSPAMWSIANGTTLGARLQRWLLQSPFRLVLCTQDGSGGEFFLRRVLRPSVDLKLLLNGVDMVTERMVPVWPKDRTIVLFLGRLETIKGAEEFMQAFLRARAQRRRLCWALGAVRRSSARTSSRRGGGNSAADCGDSSYITA